MAASGEVYNPGIMNNVPWELFAGFLNLALETASNALT